MTRAPDRAVAAAWAVLGLVILVAAWRMDRLDHQGINPWSVPGLLPGLVGLLMMLLAARLAWAPAGPPDEGGATTRAEPRDAATPEAAGSFAESAGAMAGPAGPIAEPAGGGPAALRTLGAAALCVAFAGIALGHGWPFVVESAIFVFVFIAAFSWRDWRADGRVAAGLVRTALIAVVASAAIAWLFESVFLVRLP